MSYPQVGFLLWSIAEAAEDIDGRLEGRKVPSWLKPQPSLRL
jgi:hypothetical protein